MCEFDYAMRFFMDGREIYYCKKCLTPNSRPRIQFDAQGVCNACRNAEEKSRICWEDRKKEFLDLLASYRSKNGTWDCIVPWSGGKDSSSIAWKLKHEYGMNPLLVTFSPMLPNDVGNHNREALIRAGFDHLFFRPNQKIHRILAKRFFIERGNPKVAWDAGINAIPVQVAVKYNIKLIFYAEHGESEYGGRVLNEESKKIRDFTEVIEHQIGDDPRNWLMEEVFPTDLNPYLYPSAEEIYKTGVKAMYFAYFHRWSMFENYTYIKDKIDFRTNPHGRTCGTFTDFDSLDDKFDDIYYYMQYIKFGFGRCVRDTSRFIQNGHMTRKYALELCQKYDGEFPNLWLDDILEYLDINEQELHNIIDQHRNEEIWHRDTEYFWKLNFTLS